MSEEKEIKSFKLALPYTTEDGKNSIREMNVTFKKVMGKEKGDYSNDNSPTYFMNMTIVIPDHIHKKLCGATIGRKKDINDNGSRQYSTDFSKTLSSESLSSLTERYRDVIYDYRWLISIDKMETTKVIFYTFDGNNRTNESSSWDGKAMGNSTKLSYSYMIGYISNDGTRRLNIDKKIISKKDGDQINWKYIEHTPDREVFFITIFDKFKELLEQLKTFNSNITPDMIDNMLNNGIKLLN
jgi:hypothetical protein